MVKIGLEIHGYLACKEKLFCTCDINYDVAPNTTICPICTAQPGSKPMLPNKQAVDIILAIGAFLGCTINKEMQFQRKHYSWPDLPNGYQRTMSGSYAFPSATGGNFLGITITQIHLEEDPARWNPDTGLVDYNRSGYPLVELVTEPEFTSAEHAGEWVQHLITAFSYIQAVNPQAGIKCDVNISTDGHPRVEVKNVHSISGIIQAIKHEIQRQATTQEDKIQQTRSFDEATGTTHFMRSKEHAQDYRFIPEPDLPVIEIDDEYISKVTATLPERPEQKRARYEKIGLDSETTTVLSDDIVLAELFDEVTRTREPADVAPWLRRDVRSILSNTQLTRHDVEEKSVFLGKWLDHVLGKKVSPPVAKKLLPDVLLKNLDMDSHVEKEGLAMESDDALIEKLCKESIEKNPAALADYRAGKEKAFNSLVGYVMAQTKGKADPVKAAEIMRKVIG